VARLRRQQAGLRNPRAAALVDQAELLNQLGGSPGPQRALFRNWPHSLLVGVIRDLYGVHQNIQRELISTMISEPDAEHFHISYEPENGWVLSMMTRLSQSKNPQLRRAFEEWSKTPLLEFGFAVTTRMQMLGLCIRRLNARITQLRKCLGNDEEQLRLCLEQEYAFRLPDNHLAYEVLLDIDSFIFESRSLYEIVGKFLHSFFATVFGHNVTEEELQALLSKRNIETRWINVLHDSRILFFHQTAPWLAIKMDTSSQRFYPILLKKNVRKINNPDDFVSFESLRNIYEGFVNSLDTLHQFVMEEIRSFESGKG
jgi:hypothetical protein